MSTETKIIFERLAGLASYGGGEIETAVCGRCGTLVARSQQDKHRRWHELLDQ